MPGKSLKELGRAYRTDKVTFHRYDRVYEPLFLPWKHRPTRMLEIGIYRGGNLRMWLDWFEQLDLWAVDIDPTCMEKVHHRNLRCLLGDQGDRTFLRDLASDIGPGGLDLVIDDGSHKNKDQQISFEELWPLVRPGGLYVIEDMFYAGQRGYKLPGYPRTTDYFKPWIANMLGDQPPCASIRAYFRMLVLEKPPGNPLFAEGRLQPLDLPDFTGHFDRILAGKRRPDVPRTVIATPGLLQSWWGET